MNEIEKIASFSSLYRAHKRARAGKRDEKEIILFEMNLSKELVELSGELSEGTYQLSGYYSFKVYDPKERLIHALHYRDRVVQHAICDEVLEPLLEPRLIYDNCACRKGRGTRLAVERVTGFLRDYHRKYGSDGYMLKCDIRKYFDNIDHQVLKHKLDRVPMDERARELLHRIIDSYEIISGKGLPLGNQTSQWFAIYYLDGLDRLVKEKLRVKYYSRYMDDFVLIHRDKKFLQNCLKEITEYLDEELKLELNSKTQIFPIKNGADYLGFHFYLTENGKVIRKIRRRTKTKYRKKLQYLQEAYSKGEVSLADCRQVIASYHGHMKYGHTWHLEKSILSDFVLSHGGSENGRTQRIEGDHQSEGFVQLHNDDNT